MALTSIASKFEIDEMAMRKAVECKRTDVETLKDIASREVTTHRAVSNAMKQIRDKVKGRHDSAQTLGEQDGWCKGIVPKAVEVMTRNVDMLVPQEPIMRNYDDDITTIARQVK